MSSPKSTTGAASFTLPDDVLNSEILGPKIFDYKAEAGNEQPEISYLYYPVYYNALKLPIIS